MLDAKQAVLIAKQRASEILEWAPAASSSLEELERDSYKGRDVWSITLGLPRKPGPIEALTPFRNWLQYKRFLIDAETGELVALKLREVA